MVSDIVEVRFGFKKVIIAQWPLLLYRNGEGAGDGKQKAAEKPEPQHECFERAGPPDKAGDGSILLVKCRP